MAALEAGRERMSNNELRMKKGMADTRDKSYVLAEYTALRDEIRHLNGLVSSTLHISVLASVGAIGYLMQVESLSILLFPAPFFILLPCLYTIISRVQAVMRVSGYIRVFLEEEGGLRYENRYLEYLSRISMAGPSRGFPFRKTIFYIHLSLGVMVFSVFVAKGCLPDFGRWPFVVGYLLVYISPLPFYYHAFKLVEKNWRKTFDEYWKRARDAEGARDELDKEKLEN